MLEKEMYRLWGVSRRILLISSKALPRLVSGTSLLCSAILYGSFGNSEKRDMLSKLFILHSSEHELRAAKFLASVLLL